MKSKTHLMQKICLSIMSTIFIIGILELFLYLHPSFGYITTSYTVNNDPSAMMQGKRHSPLLGFENIPNFKGVNSHGLVSEEYKLEKDKNTFRILILGDSVAEGFDTSFFEAPLKKDFFLDSKYKFEVWNGAVGAYDVRRYYLYLKHKGLRFNPDMVAIFFCLNDFEIDTSVYYVDKKGVTQYCFPASRELSRKYVLSPFLMRFSYLYRFGALRLNNYLLHREEKNHDISLKEKEGRYYLEKIKDICKKNSLPIFAVVFPYLKSFDKYDNYEQQQYQVLTQVLKDLSINYCDLHNSMLQKELYSIRDNKEDYIHPSREGHHFFAKIVYDYFLDFFKDIYGRIS